MGLMKKLTSAVVASSLVLSLAAPVLAEVTADDAQAAYARLNYYGIAEGILREDGTKDPALDENLTRAQLVAMIVKAFGQKEYAEMLAGAQTFSDVPTSHWASGYLAIAKNIAAQNGNTIGYPDGTFGPENNVTAIEALAFVLKFLGVQVPGGDNWVEATIAAAKNAGVITDADVEKYLANPNEPATRGLAFAMADSIFYNYNGLDGKSVYTKYRDTEAPVVSLDAAPATTEKATIEITGKVSGDYREVYVGSDAITVAEDGTFSAQVALQIGTNTIEVSAKDWAGNVGSAKLVIERVAGQAAKIQIVAPEGPVVAGSTIDLPVLVVDAEGADTGLTDVKVDAGEAGTWAEGKLTAATKAGKYTITASYEGLETATVEIEIVAGPLAKVEAETKSVKPGTAVKLIGVDQYGNKVEGVTFAEAEDYAEAFIEGDQFIATKAGTYKVIGTKGEGEEAVKVEGTVSVFGEHASFTITVDGDLVANGATKHKVIVSAVDKDGNVVTDFDGTVTLESNFGTTLSKDAENGVATFEVVVPVGMEGLDAEFTARYQKDEDSDPIEATASFEVKAQVGTSIELKGDEYLAINQPAFSGTVRILDQLGEELVAGDDYEVTLTITGPAYFAGTTDKEMEIELSGGVVDFAIKPVDIYTEGNVTITATAEGLTSATLEVKAVYALDAKDLAIKDISKDPVKAATANSYYEFEIKLVDKNGVPVQGNDQTVTLEFDTDDYDQLAVYAVDEDGDLGDKLDWVDEGKVQVTIAKGAAGQRVKVAAQKLVGDVTVKATAEDLGSATGKVSFKAGDLAQVAFKKRTLNVLSNEENTLTIALRDAAGNAVAKADVEVKVEATGANADYVKIGGSTKKAVTVKTDANGEATVSVTLLPYIGNGQSATISATVEGVDTPATATLTVVPSVSKSISVTTYVYTNDGWKPQSSFNAGDIVYVHAVVTDNNGIKVTDPSFASRLSLSGIKVTEINNGVNDKVDDEDEKLPKFQWGEGLAYSGETEDEVNDLLPEAIHAGFKDVEAFVARFMARKAGTFSLTVSDSTAATKVERTRAISVKADDAANLKFVGDKITFKANEPTKVVLSVVDAYGNKVGTSAVKAPFVGKKFTVSVYDMSDPDNPVQVGKVRASATGLDKDEHVITIEKSVVNYTVYVVAFDLDGDEEVTTDNLVIELVDDEDEESGDGESEDEESEDEESEDEDSEDEESEDEESEG